jgi:hypothetical protein
MKYHISVGEIGGVWWSAFVFGVATKENGSISQAERGNGWYSKSIFLKLA